MASSMCPGERCFLSRPRTPECDSRQETPPRKMPHFYEAQRSEPCTAVGCAAILDLSLWAFFGCQPVPRNFSLSRHTGAALLSRRRLLSGSHDALLERQPWQQQLSQTPSGKSLQPVEISVKRIQLTASNGSEKCVQAVTSAFQACDWLSSPHREHSRMCTVHLLSEAGKQLQSKSFECLIRWPRRLNAMTCCNRAKQKSEPCSW